MINSIKYFITIIFLMVFISSCKDVEENCGCNSEAYRSVPIEWESVGQIVFKPSDIDDYYPNHYWITYTDNNCPTCANHMIVCNENIIPEDLKEEIRGFMIDESMDVKFSGHLKKVCIGTISIANIAYNRITLASIEKN